MNYVDGFVVPVQKKKVAAYRSMAKLSAKVWLQHGALAFLRFQFGLAAGQPRMGPHKVGLRALRSLS